MIRAIRRTYHMRRAVHHALEVARYQYMIQHPGDVPTPEYAVSQYRIQERKHLVLYRYHGALYARAFAEASVAAIDLLNG